MKSIIKLALAISLLVGFAYEAKSAVASANVATATTNYLLSGTARTSQFLLTSTNLTGNSIFTFFDAPTNGLYWTNTAYSNVTWSLQTTWTNIYTNYFGATNTVIYTNSVIQPTTNSVAAATNMYPMLFTITVPTNSTISVDFGARMINGLAFTNSGGGSATVTYSQ